MKSLYIMKLSYNLFFLCEKVANEDNNIANNSGTDFFMI